MQDQCFALTNMLSIQSKRSKVLELYHQICSNLDFGKGKKGYLALAACVFIIIRQDKVPLTIADVYKCLSQEYGPIHYKDLGKMFSFIVSQFKLDVPLSDFYSYFEKCIHSIPTLDRQKFITRSQSLAEFGKLSGLDTGKSKASICVAVVLLALEAESASKPSKEIILDTCDLLSVSKRQVMTRRREFVLRLIEYGQRWPCFDDLDTKNFSSLLGTLVDWGSGRDWKHELSFDPPAYQKSIAKCAETLDRISLVKRAIDQENMALLNERELLIAEYIQEGYSNQEIVDYNPLYKKKRKTSERAADKTQNEKNLKILKELMKLPENKRCVDCRKRDPRWASWNLGIFFCIRCSGIHRSLGVHISKVKSVDLDTWTTEQVDNMVKWGNSKANSYWESQLPSNFEPPEGTIEQWIRAKYERKQFATPGPVPDPDTLTDTKADGNTPRTSELIHIQSKSTTPAVSNIQKSQVPPVQVKASASPMDDLFNAFQSANQSSGKVTDLKSNILSLYSNPPSNNPPALSTSLGSGSNSTTNNGFADFADFANFSQFKTSNPQPVSVPKNEGVAEFDFFSSSSPPKSTPISAVPQQSNRNDSILDIDPVDFHKPSPVTASKALEIDFARFSISNSEISKASITTPSANIGVSNGFSSNATASTYSQKMDAALFNHWGDPEPPKAPLPEKAAFVESSTISTPMESIISSPAVPTPMNEAPQFSMTGNFSGSGTTATLPVSTNSALDFVDPWSDFQ